MTIEDQVQQLRTQVQDQQRAMMRQRWGLRGGACVLGVAVVAGFTWQPAGAVGTVDALDGILTLEMVNGRPTARFSGVNLQVVNGTGTTGGAVNGLGNLLVGYNTLNGLGFNNKNGSHNLVVGEKNSYSSFGGVVFGFRNRSVGPYGTVTGGALNAARFLSAVSGGRGNSASFSFSSVSGGEQNQATGQFASVSGGQNNTASGNWSSVSGGGSSLPASGNVASANYASVSGGVINTASGLFSSVSGGQENTANAGSSTVSGGENNTAGADFAVVSGGQSNTASGQWSSVSGGEGHTASGGSSTVSGGSNNNATNFAASVSGGDNQTNAAAGTVLGEGTINPAD